MIDSAESDDNLTAVATKLFQTAGDTMRKNKDGKYNLRDLRAAVDASDSVSVYYQGGWHISRRIMQRDCFHQHIWIDTPAPYYMDERAVLQHALEIETYAR